MSMGFQSTVFRLIKKKKKKKKKKKVGRKPEAVAGSFGNESGSNPQAFTDSLRNEVGQKPEGFAESHRGENACWSRHVHHQPVPARCKPASA